MSAHTPGPWEWDAGLIPPDGPERYADIYVNGGDTIIASFNDCLPEGRANARLIAAAPDLLAALIKLSNEVLGSLPLIESQARRDMGNTNYALLLQRADEARAAIAHATPQ